MAATQPANLFSTMLVPNMTERLHELRCPILGFLGRNDNFNPASGAIEDLDHAPTPASSCSTAAATGCQVEHADLFNRSCIDFLTRG